MWIAAPNARSSTTPSLDLLAAFCNQAAIAIDNARLFADLRHHIREITAMKTYMENIFASIASGVVTADTRGHRDHVQPSGGAHLQPRAARRRSGGRTRRRWPSIGDAAVRRDSLRAPIIERAVTLGHEMTRTLPQRGEVELRLNVSPLRGGAMARASRWAWRWWWTI